MPKRYVMKTSALLVLMLLVGCSSQRVPSLAEVNNTNIKKLRGAYGLYLFQHSLRGPESEEQLKEYLRTDEGAQVKLGRMGMTVDQIDSIFISERDGKPFKVRYGLRGLGDHAAVFEAEGVDGKRMVALTNPREVDEAEYDQLWNQERPESTGMGL